LGRETGIARCVWRDDDWLYLAEGGLVPPVALPGPSPAARAPDAPVLRQFSGPDLPPEFQWLRTPDSGRIFSLTGSALRLTGRESLGSWFEQALVARRQEHPAYRAETGLIADPVSWQQAAGLVTYYNRHKFHAALLTREAGNRVLTIVSCLGDWPDEALTFSGKPQPVPDGPIRLAVVVNGASQQFLWAGPDGDFTPLGPQLDASIVSDEAGRGEHASFTGAFVGMVAYDLTGQGWSADFLDFGYHPAD
jgi:xylan 1,4-beta-xylosidase